eukprot:TRINITY_DN302_c0_g2_i1.p1 TRINITY_DN302_c0_g2~~TRINITY_DN302_c0_g2_i1.p1  ORF type:complete len:454 (+),score=127.47 TRINITY_DN302_c0_g2_i1:63-1424(+)
MEDTSVILCLDVPEGTNFGLDMMEFQCGPKFKGIKLIPPGVHYVHYSSCSNVGGDVGSRIGFFLHTKEGEVIVRKWNPSLEELETLSEEEELGFIHGVKNYDFDSFLGPYDESKKSEWDLMTLNMSDELLKRITPVSGAVRSAAAKAHYLMNNDKNDVAVTDDNNDGNDSKTDEKESDMEIDGDGEEESKNESKIDIEDNTRVLVHFAGVGDFEEDFSIRPRQNNNKPSSSSSSPSSFTTGTDAQAQTMNKLLETEASVAGIDKVFFTSFPIKFPPMEFCDTPERITMASMDSTELLISILEKKFDNRPDLLLGELEAAFILFLHGQSLEAFEQWGAMVRVFCKCDALLCSNCAAHANYRTYTIGIMVPFLKALIRQLKMFPEDFFKADLSEDNLLGEALKDLFASARDGGLDVESSVSEILMSLEKVCQSRFDYNPAQIVESEEDQPVIVEL